MFAEKQLSEKRATVASCAGSETLSIYMLLLDIRLWVGRQHKLRPVISRHSFDTLLPYIFVLNSKGRTDSSALYSQTRPNKTCFQVQHVTLLQSLHFCADRHHLHAAGHCWISRDRTYELPQAFCLYFW